MLAALRVHVGELAAAKLVARFRVELRHLSDLLSVLSSSPMVAPIRWRPATDICETPDSITITVELAGVREEDLDIELYPDAVIVSGSRSPQLCGPEAIYHALEIR